MITIKNKNEIIEMILGTQSNDTDKNYILSPYTIFIEYKEVFLLYNVLTNELAIISENEYFQLKNNNFSYDFKNFLIENWFMFSDNIKPTELVTQLRELIKNFGVDNKRHGYTILTTTGCNARCFYCYQAGTPVRVMNENTALKVVDYIEQRRNGASIRFRWFGGEPLCNTKAIDIICSKFIENGTEFSSTIVSNGYLFDKAMCKKAKELWKLTDAQITIDGLDETYNKAKNYVNKSDPNPFRTVLANIKNLLDEDIAVDIRLNIDKHNYDELRALILMLNNYYDGYKKLSIYCRPLFENVGFVKTVRNDLDRTELTMKFIEMEKFIDSLGRRCKIPLNGGIKLYSCMADSPNGGFISPEGNIGNCEHFPDTDFNGSIFNNDTVKPWDKYYDDIEECEKCSAYPNCRRLIGCNEHPECYEFERYLLVDKIIHGIQSAYDSYLKKKGQ